MSQREDLLAGAKKCLVEKGYSKTTARDIAAASGAHLASIGYHFGSKDRLMNTVVIEATSEWGDILEDALRKSTSTNPDDRLQVLVSTMLATLPRQHELLVASVQAMAQAQFDDDIRAAYKEGLREARRELAALVLGVEADEVDPDTAAGLGSIINNMINGYMLQYLVEPESLPTSDQALAGLRKMAPPD